MPQLEVLVSQWADQLRVKHPHLAPHIEEISDHVHSSAAQLMASGALADEAFAAALGTFGAPTDLATEFGKNARLLKRAEAKAVILYLIITFVFTASVVTVHAVHGLGNQAILWIVLAWVVTTALHDVMLRRARRGVV